MLLSTFTRQGSMGQTVQLTKHITRDKSSNGLVRGSMAHRLWVLVNAYFTEKAKVYKESTD